MEQRFSKKALASDLYPAIVALSKRHNFDVHNGTAQLKGCNPETWYAYGKWRLMLDLMQRYGLDDHIPENQFKGYGRGPGDSRFVKD